MNFIEADVLKLSDRIVKTEHHDSVIDYLSEYYPDGFGEKNCTISVNGIEIKLDNYDVLLADDAVIVLMFHPALAVGVIGGSVVTFIANLLIGAAVSYVVGQIFKPSIPELQTSLAARNSGQASSVYSLNSQQNEAKIGAIIPIIYGSVRTYPALIAAPYYRYENNEEYLYQLMCVGQGKFNINKMLISDTDTIDIQSDYFRYEKLEYDDFKTVAGIAAKVNAPNYNGLVKTIPDVDNLELRGTPQDKQMLMRFEGSIITFYPFADGSEPDLSALSSGSLITITETDSNDGTYTVDSIAGLVVTVQSHTFVTEPTTFKEYNTGLYIEENQMSFYVGNVILPLDFDVGIVFKWSGTVDNDGIAFRHDGKTQGGDGYYRSDTSPVATEELFSGVFRAYFQNAMYNAEFSTSYGSFSYDKEHIGFEVDIVYPNGVYDTDSAGEFIARDTVSDIILDNTNISETVVITTSGELDNSAIRITYKYIYADNAHATLQPNMHLNFKRVTAEPSDIKSMDKTYIARVKFILEEKNYEPLGDLTLLWCKIRATNAISSIGQFAINAWVTRNDVANDVKSVITDVYTNDVYGGRLPATDLDLDDTTGDVVNGAIDSKMTLFDAMQMVGKSNRYTVFPVGNDIKLKHDAAKPIRTALYNETNILKDSLKISYLFEEVDETDSVKITYRDDSEFKEVTAIYPTDGVFPEEIELWGCTSESVALAMATYLYKQDRARRKSIEFKTDIQGLIPQFLDRIAVSHNLPEWGVSGQVSYVNGNFITLSCSYDLNDGVYDSIIFRKEEGSVSDIISMVVIDSKTVEITGTIPEWLYDGEEFDKTNFSMGISNTFVKDYIVISVKPNGNEITITATNYDETIY